MSERSKVFVAEMVLKVSDNGPLRPTFDITPASTYGELVTLSTNKDINSLSPGVLVTEYRQKLKNYCDNDYILAIGDPVKIGVACVIASHFNRGTVNVLKWDRHAKSYISITFKI